MLSSSSATSSPPTRSSIPNLLIHSSLPRIAITALICGPGNPYASFSLKYFALVVGDFVGMRGEGGFVVGFFDFGFAGGFGDVEGCVEVDFFCCYLVNRRENPVSQQFFWQRRWAHSHVKALWSKMLAARAYFGSWHISMWPRHILVPVSVPS